MQLLQRSLDGGVTWPKQYDVVLYDETKSTADKKKFLYPIDPPRADYDMFQKDSVFFFGRTYLPELRGDVPVCFALRSVDRGKTWETVPTIVKHPAGDLVKLHKDCYPVVRMPDGKTLLAAMSAGMSADNQRGVAIYESTDNGLHWKFKSRPAIDLSDTGQFTYTNLLLMPNGDLQAYFLHISKGTKAQNTPVDGLKDAICMATSHDGGTTWDDAAPIVGKYASCWKNPGERRRAISIALANRTEGRTNRGAFRAATDADGDRGSRQQRRWKNLEPRIRRPRRRRGRRFGLPRWRPVGRRAHLHRVLLHNGRRERLRRHSVYCE